MSARASAYEFLADCPHCRTEAAVVTVMDPAHEAHAHGLAVEATCRMCGHKVIADGALAREVAPPCDLRSAHAAAAALRAFAAAEGESVAEILRVVDRTLGRRGRSKARERRAGPDELRRHRVAVSRRRAQQRRRRDRRAHRRPAPRRSAPGARSREATARSARGDAGPRVGHGRRRPDPAHERAFVDDWLVEHGLPAILPSDLRLWRPDELGAPNPTLRDALVDALVHLAHLDAEPDDAEWRVVIAYGRAWGADEKRMIDAARRYDARYATPLVHVWRRLTRMVRTR